MPRIEVSTAIAAAPEQVWAHVADVTSHVEWMTDAEAIRLTSAQRSGEGTTFECDTRIGPFRLTDRMEITEWKEGEAMGVAHSGLVTGSGRFTLRPEAGGTRFTWVEDLRFPWWMGGPAAGVVGRRVLERVWRRNLRALRAGVEEGG